MKNHSSIMSELLEISEKSYYRWRSKDHIRLIQLIESNFKDSELVEFLETGMIQSKNNSFEELSTYVHNIHKTITDKPEYKIDGFLKYIIRDFNKKNTSCLSDIFDEFMEYIHKIEFIKPGTPGNNAADNEYIKMYIMNRVHRVSKFEFYLYVKNIGLIMRKRL